MKELPGVGKNLQDHLLTGVVYESAKPVPKATWANHSETTLFWPDDERGLEQPKLDRLRRELECDRGRHTRDASEDTRSAAVHLVHLRSAVREAEGRVSGGRCAAGAGRRDIRR